jgi:dinuclear metal center YbgI/SA1388 family protein
MKTHAVETFLEEFAPLRLAESWDNVGLLVGDRQAEVRRIMTCLTVTPGTVEEAVSGGAELIVTHHPLPFSAVKRLTTDTTVGRMLLKLISAGVAVYSPHTAFDSAAEGINQRLAEGLGLTEIEPIVPCAGVPALAGVMPLPASAGTPAQGTGRRGRPAATIALSELARRLIEFLGIANLQTVGDLKQRPTMVAVACGAAGELVDAAWQAGCDAMVLGEARFHTCLEAESRGIGLLLPGHYASERFAVEALADLLARRFAGIHVWASRLERDPLRWFGQSP